MTPTFEDDVVDGPTPLAVRDYGGSGRPVLLLHGATRNLADWAPIAAALARHHRVVAMDLRSHGRSAAAPWVWDGVLDDVDRVVEQAGLGRPAIVGHSLGGMIAALYDAKGGSTTCVMNLDGYGPGRPDQYPGIPPEQVLRFHDEAMRAGIAARPDASGPIDDAELSRVRAAALDAATTYGISAELEGATFDRSLRRISPATWAIAPSAAAVRMLLEAVRAVDWFGVFREVASPFLIYKSATEVPSGLGIAHEAEFVAAYHQGLRRELAALAEHSPNVQVRLPRTHHGLIFTMPDRLAAEIHRFVDDAP